MARPRKGLRANRRQATINRKLDGRQPGEIVLLSRKQGTRKRSGREFVRAEWVVRADGELFVDIDARKYVRAIQLALADHCGDSLERQVSPETGAPIRPGTETAANAQLRRRFGSPKQTTGTMLDSGKMASHWYIGKINGAHLNARGIIRPTISGFKLQWVNYYLGATIAIEKTLTGTAGDSAIAIRRKGPAIDLQSVDGLAAEVIAGAVQAHVDGAMGATVNTERRPHVGITDRKNR